MSARYVLLAWFLVLVAAASCLAMQGCGPSPRDACEVRGGYYEQQPVGGMTCYSFGTVTTCEPNTRSVCVVPPRGTR